MKMFLFVIKLDVRYDIRDYKPVEGLEFNALTSLGIVGSHAEEALEEAKRLARSKGDRLSEDGWCGYESHVADVRLASVVTVRDVDSITAPVAAEYLND